MDADRARNIQLLKEQAWFDIPMVYNDGRRTIIAIEKGTPATVPLPAPSKPGGSDFLKLCAIRSARHEGPGVRQRSSSGRVLPNPDVLVRKEDALASQREIPSLLSSPRRELIRGR